jgi:hypothetical protein
MSKTFDMVKLAKQKGLTMVDAVEPLSLVVTKDDIKVAKRKDPTCCAFAVAAKRQYQIDGAWVLRSAAWLQIGNQLVRYQLTRSMSAEIVAFDRARAMAPGTYNLTTIVPSRRLAPVSRGTRKKRRSPGSTRARKRPSRARASTAATEGKKTNRNRFAPHVHTDIR